MYRPSVILSDNIMLPYDLGFTVEQNLPNIFIRQILCRESLGKPGTDLIFITQPFTSPKIDL